MGAKCTGINLAQQLNKKLQEDTRFMYCNVLGTNSMYEA